MNSPESRQNNTRSSTTAQNTSGTKRRVADVILDTLAAHDVRTFFGVPGGAVASLYDALIDHTDFRVINTRHESGAAFMAMGHARVAGGLAGVLMTSGPGITNALTGMAAAHADGVPLVAIAGEVPRRYFGRGALQEGSRYNLDILGMARSVTKYAVEITNPRAAAAIMTKAVTTALSGRKGPVLVSVPLDVASDVVIPTKMTAHPSMHFDLDEHTIDEIAAVICRARRPLLLVGSGARYKEAASRLLEFAERFRIPVATTPKAKGVFPETHPQSLGVFGHGGHASATEYVGERVDVLICVGCGLGETGTNSWSEALQPSTAFIQIDIDVGQVGKNYHVDYAVVGPAHSVLEALLLRPTSAEMPSRKFGGIRYIEPKAAEEDTVPLKPPRALRLLQEKLPDDTLFTVDIGEHMIFGLHYLRFSRPDAFIVNSGLGSMGSGIGTAIGAKVAMPDRPVVAICGDFGFQMLGMEFATCVQEKIGVVFAVFNDARMRMVESGLTKIFGRSLGMHSHRVDFAAVAKALGGIGYSIRNADELRSLPMSALSGTTPVVLDIAIDPNASFSEQGRAEQLRSFAVDR